MSRGKRDNVTGVSTKIIARNGNTGVENVKNVENEDVAHPAEKAKSQEINREEEELN